MSTTFLQPDPAALTTRGPFRLAIALLCVATVTILWGALTTSTGSGMAYADWPLSDSQLMPESSYTQLPHFLEHFHRVFASGTGLVALSLWIWLAVSGRADRRATRTAFLGGCLVLLQGVVGGTGVLLNLPAVTSVTHGTLAQLTLATFGWLTYQLSSRYQATEVARDVAPGTGRKLVLFALVIVVFQTVIGAVARHTNNSHALWTHVGHAFVVFLVIAIATAFATGKLSRTRGVKGLSQTIIGLLVLQIVLGFVALAIRNEAGKSPENVDRLGAAITISFHVLLGALLTVLIAALAAHVFRATRRPDAA
ncbi:MAG: COX15/CtaA family protein [Planctomycetota bacterium]|nr:COX15/CtaA family protein [Planctomycetota bacterium]